MKTRIALFVLSVAAMAAFGLFTQARAQYMPRAPQNPGYGGQPPVYVIPDTRGQNAYGQPQGSGQYGNYPNGSQYNNGCTMRGGAFGSSC